MFHIEEVDGKLDCVDFGLLRHCHDGETVSRQRFTQQNQEQYDEDAFLKGLHEVLVQAVQVRCQCITEIFHEQAATVLVMFSGGLDSALLAAILADILPVHVNLDLVNVSFDAANSPDRISALLTLEDIQRIKPERRIRLLCSDHQISKDALNEPQFQLVQSLIHPKDSHMDFNIAMALHLASLAKQTS